MKEPTTQELSAQTAHQQPAATGLAADQMDNLAEGDYKQRSLRRGEIVSATVVSVDREGIWVDVGAKSEGVIPIHEARALGADGLSQVKPGDQFPAYVLRIGEGDGQVVLSLDRAAVYQGWRLVEQYFEKGETFQAKVSGHNKGGLIVSIEGVSGFVPASQVVGYRRQGEADSQRNAWLQQMAGQPIELKVIELDRRRNRLILSQKVAAEERRERQSQELFSQLQEGQIRKGRVSGIHSFGAFVDLGGVDGLVPLSEISWQRGKSAAECFKLGEEVEVMVLKTDSESKRIVLSLRRTQPHPWQTVASRYQPGQLVVGTITKLTAFGAFARFDDGLEGLVHISELADRRISHPKEVVNSGDQVTLKVLSIEPERRRLRLSLKQALEDGETGLNKVGTLSAKGETESDPRGGCHG